MPSVPAARLVVAMAAVAAAGLAHDGPRAADETVPPVTFEEHVRPLLKAHCLDCHGATETLEGSLDLRLVRLMRAGGDSGPAIVPGDAAASLILQRVRSGEMPPGEKKMSAAEQDLLARWISAGAPTKRPEPEAIAPGLAITPEAEAREGKSNQFIHTYEGLLGLVAVAHERIGAVIDGWALHVTGESPDIVAKVPKGRLVEIRLSDAPRESAGTGLTHAQRLMPGETGVIDSAAILRAAHDAGFNGPVTPYADRSTLAGRGREKIVRLAGDRLEAIWKAAGLTIAPRWFTPVARDALGRPIEEIIGAAAAAGAAE